MAQPPDLPAGDFATWLREMRAALRDGGELDVPCGGCNACCKSAYFIHIRPDERETLKRIPRRLRFPAPGLPRGHVVLGYDERGHCPMLVDDRCSIYEHRPRTCRSYDCRIFPATGLDTAGDGKAQLDARIRRWRFDLASEADGRLLAAARAAASFLRDRAHRFPAGAVPSNLTQLATFALTVLEVFTPAEPPDDGGPPPSDDDLAAAALRAHERFHTPPPPSPR